MLSPNDVRAEWNNYTVCIASHRIVCFFIIDAQTISIIHTNCRGASLCRFHRCFFFFCCCCFVFVFWPVTEWASNKNYNKNKKIISFFVFRFFCFVYGYCLVLFWFPIEICFAHSSNTPVRGISISVKMVVQLGVSSRHHCHIGHSLKLVFCLHWFLLLYFLGGIFISRFVLMAL